MTHIHTLTKYRMQSEILHQIILVLNNNNICWSIPHKSIKRPSRRNCQKSKKSTKLMWVRKRNKCVLLEMKMHKASTKICKPTLQLKRELRLKIKSKNLETQSWRKKIWKCGDLSKQGYFLCRICNNEYIYLSITYKFYSLIFTLINWVLFEYNSI